MRVVLLQVRDDEPAEAQERLCFLEACRLAPDQLESINLIQQPRIDWSEIEGADAILVGGAGAHSATRRYEFSAPLEAVVRRAVVESVPFFGSCFGHHILVTAMGGHVVTDHETGEVGTFEIELTPAGREEPMLAGYPERFAAQLGHHDRVETLPEGFVELARSERNRFQMLTVLGKPVYSSQFHCELTEQHLLARLEMYRDTYLAEQTDREELSDRIGPSPWADRLLERFMASWRGTDVASSGSDRD